MDFDIGNILYIVITLVAVIIGLLGKKKKPGTQGTGEGGTTQPGFMENLERMLTGEEVRPAVADLQEFEEDLPPEEEPEYAFESESEGWATRNAPNIMDEYERIMRSNDQEDPDKDMEEDTNLSAPLEMVELDEESGANFFDVVKGFDARKAIVYSAIINRLDY